MHQRPGEVHTFDDSRLASELLRLSNANEELLAEPELAKLMFPIIRNDYRLIETYRPGKITVLTTPSKSSCQSSSRGSVSVARA